MFYTSCAPDASVTDSSEYDCNIRPETYPERKGLLLCVATRVRCRFT